MTDLPRALTWLLTALAFALSSVTAASVGMAIVALIDDRLLATLFAGAAVLLDLFKYVAWPLALYAAAAQRHVCAWLLIGCAVVLAGISGWATADRMLTSIITSRGQQQALMSQRVVDLEVGRVADLALLEHLNGEALSIRSQSTSLRDRGMVSKALELESAGQARVDQERERALSRLERSSLELTQHKGRQVKAASLPMALATLLCLGFAAALEIVPALILTALRPSATPENRQKLAIPLEKQTVETPDATDYASAMSVEDAQLLQNLVQNAACSQPGEKIAIREFAKGARIGNVRAGVIFRAAESIGVIRKTATGYVTT